MKSFLNYTGKKIYYSDEGKGTVIVLLHGYLESLEIWGDFSKELSRKFRVICFDIPGHGYSQELDSVHTMEQLAQSIFYALKQLEIKKCFMIGHSMGGYVTLMFHKLYPELLTGFSLFHSHPFADTEEIKNKRSREMGLVNEGKKDFIAKFNIPNAFANDNLDRFKNEIENAVNIGLRTSEKGIVANLYAMMNRPDFSESLKNSKIPFLYIAGKKDNYIDFNTVVPKIRFPGTSKLIVLENSGHMGFVEEKSESIKHIIQFIEL